MKTKSKNNRLQEYLAKNIDGDGGCEYSGLIETFMNEHPNVKVSKSDFAIAILNHAAKNALSITFDYIGLYSPNIYFESKR